MLGPAAGEGPRSLRRGTGTLALSPAGSGGSREEQTNGGNAAGTAGVCPGQRAAAIQIYKVSIHVILKRTSKSYLYICSRRNLETVGFLFIFFIFYLLFLNLLALIITRLMISVFLLLGG